ncbi:MAG: glucosaminidase domain-containing protein [Acidobacteria bacterium]|nr:glucosaminidase domain-containing protein [Acidobacteriota bacterium]MBI3470337.1 glucosaminidase domain-containing protein [Candidatus Solibacter usitatus]
MRRLLSNGLAMFAGVVSLPVAATNPPSPPCVYPRYQNDPRLARLREFFEQRDCPAQQFSEAFLRASDTYSLDWRLLPSISLVESGGGREARNNNVLGWANGRHAFASVDQGIHQVASRLAQSKLYRDKNLEEVLETYNPGANYPAVVKTVMQRIAPE